MRSNGDPYSRPSWTGGAVTLKNLFGNLALVVTPFVLLELAFRALPVSNPPYVLPVTAESPIARLQADKRFTWSKGWNFSIRTNKYSNNFGYVNQNDYDPELRSPLLILIGDSYVEANQVDAGRSAAELLHSKVRNKGRVYSIGLSGAPLSQYLAFAEYARVTFRPHSLAFVVVGNDFDESLLKYYASQRFHVFRESDGELELERIDYRVSNARALLRRSAVIRYVMLNLDARSTLRRALMRNADEKTEYVGNVPAEVGDERLIDSKKAVDEFFRQLPERSGLETANILFVIDGSRPALYSPEGLRSEAASYFGGMKRYFKAQAAALGYEVVDMQPAFVSRNRRDESRFEFPTDGHWNELGNRLVAEEISKSDVFRSTFEDAGPEN